MHILAELTPLDPVGGSRPLLRAASAQDRRLTSMVGERWWPAISKLPALTMQLFDGDFTSNVSAGSAAFQVQLDGLEYLDADARSYLWAGAGVTLHAIPVGETVSDLSEYTIFKGKVSRFAADGAGLSLTADVDSELFAKNVLNLEYAGTTGIEGGEDLKGKLKPWIFGRALNVEPVMIDKVNNVFQFSAYGPIELVEAVFERGVSFGASLGNFANYDELVAADIPEGRWAMCLAQGLIRLGAPPYGVITGDIRGDKPASWIRLTGQILFRIATHAGVPEECIDGASLAALDEAVPYPINIVLTEQTTVIDLAQTLARPCNAQAGISWLGQLFVTRLSIGSHTLTLDAQGRRLPGVMRSTESDVQPPYKRIMLGAARSWRVHTFDEIGFDATLLDKGTFSSAETYRYGNIVTLANGSRWLFIADVAAAGSTPGLGNPDWEQLSGPITYADGTPIEDLKPAEPGATVGAPPGTPVGDRTAEVLTAALDAAEVAVADAHAQVAAARSDVAAEVALARANEDAIRVTQTALQADFSGFEAQVSSDLTVLSDETASLSDRIDTVSASSGAIGITPNGDFRNGGVGWFSGADLIVDGLKKFFRAPAGRSEQLNLSNLVPMDPNRAYRVNLKIRVVGGPSQIYFGAVIYDKYGSHLGNAYAPAAGPGGSRAMPPGTYDLSHPIKGIEDLAVPFYGVVNVFPPAAALITPLVLANYPDGPQLGDVEILGLWISDVTDVAAVDARVTDEQTARVDADSALASRATAVEAQLGGTAESAILSRITNEETSRVAADSALAARTTAVEASYVSKQALAASQLDMEMELSKAVDDYWTYSNDGLLKTTAWGADSCLSWPGGNGDTWFFSKKYIPVDTSKVYRISTRVGAWYNGSSGHGSTMYAGFVGLDAAGNLVDHGSYGSYRYAALTAVNILDGQFLKFEALVTGEGNDSWQKFPPGTKQISLMGIFNIYGDPYVTSYMDYLRFEDIEEADRVDVRLSDVEIALSSADGALASRASTLEAKVAGTVGSGLSAAISDESIARSTGDGALAARSSTLEAQVAGTVGSALLSAISDEATARSTADSALASRASGVEARAGDLESRAGISETAIADAANKLAAARLTLGASTPGGRVEMSFKSDLTGAGIDIVGDVALAGDMLVNGTITAEKIQLLGVGTERIALNAAQEIMVVRSASNVVVSSDYVQTPVLSGTYTKLYNDSLLLVDFVLRLQAAGGAGDIQITAQFMIDGVQPTGGAWPLQLLGGGSAAIALPFPFSFVAEGLAAGAHSFRMDITKLLGASSITSGVMSTMKITEVKR